MRVVVMGGVIYQLTGGTVELFAKRGAWLADEHNRLKRRRQRSNIKYRAPLEGEQITDPLTGQKFVYPEGARDE